MAYMIEIKGHIITAIKTVETEQQVRDEIRKAYDKFSAGSELFYNGASVRIEENEESSEVARSYGFYAGDDWLCDLNVRFA